MTYQGARAQAATKEADRLFAVSAVHLDSTGHVTRVRWAEVNAASNLAVGNGVTAPVSEVVDALHAGHQVFAHFPAGSGHRPERPFVVIEHADGLETIVLYGAHTPDREVADIATLHS